MITAQRQFVNYTAVNLGLMIIAAIVGSFVLNTYSGKLMIVLIIAILLTICFVITIVICNLKLEQTWYDGIAIAESVKILSWRYISGTEPNCLDYSVTSDELFISNLLAVVKERHTFSYRLSAQYNYGQQITEKMKYIGTLSIKQQKSIYLSERIKNQVIWYNEKAQSNLKSASRFYFGTIIAQEPAIITAFSILIWQNSIIQITGICTTLAKACMAWTQMKRNEELTHSYGIPAQELSFINEISSQVATEEQLSSYVVNSEKAISRERTMWLTRRS
jgi:hypothetical protein